MLTLNLPVKLFYRVNKNSQTHTHTQSYHKKKFHIFYFYFYLQTNIILLSKIILNKILFQVIECKEERKKIFSFFLLILVLTSVCVYCFYKYGYDVWSVWDVSCVGDCLEIFARCGIPLCNSQWRERWRISGLRKARHTIPCVYMRKLETSSSGTKNRSTPTYIHKYMLTK